MAVQQLGPGYLLNTRTQTSQQPLLRSNCRPSGLTARGYGLLKQKPSFNCVKFQHHSVAADVDDLLEPVGNNPYEVLKCRLLECYCWCILNTAVSSTLPLGKFQSFQEFSKKIKATESINSLLNTTLKNSRFLFYDPLNDRLHLLRHHLLTYNSVPRRLPPDGLEVARKEFDILLHLCIIRPTSSSWAFSFTHVNVWRLCDDYRHLYNIPHLNDFLSRLSGRRIFSKVDAIRSNQQIPVVKENVPKTAITTAFVLFECVRMPFRLNKSCDEVTRRLEFCFVYLDSILVASRTKEGYEEHLINLFRRFESPEPQTFPPQP
ncbi:Polyprotein P3 [Trichinella pseudospiralis]|uniref:Polyprotein P3 n=1 Tax=Trichinella pseudospiralis TaxID=6337 RepID=A0A0V1JFQ5_TRIPS|nr:Polyprotein P3 [Trichinella pseudospiralis]